MVQTIGYGECQIPPEELVNGAVITQFWHAEFIFLSLMISTIGAHASLLLAEELKYVASSLWYRIFVWLAGLALGGCTIWAMHFIGMQALELRSVTVDGVEVIIEISFEISLTVVSGLAACVIATLGLHILAGRAALERHLKDKEMVIRLLTAATIIMVGVCVMHYMGMISQSGYFTSEYKVGIVALSAVIAFIAATAGLFILMFFPANIFARMASAVVIAVAVNAMHYTGMQAATYYASTKFHTVLEDGSYTINALLVTSLTIFVILLLHLVRAQYGQLRAGVKQQVAHDLAFENAVEAAPQLLKSVLQPRFPMAVLPLATLRQLGKLIAYETLRDTGQLIHLDTYEEVMTLRNRAWLLFMSHQWLGDAFPDPENVHYDMILTAADKYLESAGLEESYCYVWVDYASVPQSSEATQQLAIDSIGFYTVMSSAFIAVVPRTTHCSSGKTCDFETYRSRVWCRVEAFTKILGVCAAMGPKPGATGAEQQSELEGNLLLLANSNPDSRDEHMFIADENGLRPFDLWRRNTDPITNTRRLVLKTEMRDLCFPYFGELTCCKHNHIRGGQIVACDKMRMVNMLVGLYGHVMLVRAMHEVRMRGVSELGDKAPAEPSDWEKSCYEKSLAIAELAKGDSMFPEEFYGRWLEAMGEHIKFRLEDEAEGGMPALPGEGNSSHRSSHSHGSSNLRNRTPNGGRALLDLRDVEGGARKAQGSKATSPDELRRQKSQASDKSSKVPSRRGEGQGDDRGESGDITTTSRPVHPSPIARPSSRASSFFRDSGCDSPHPQRPSAQKTLQTLLAETKQRAAAVNRWYSTGRTSQSRV